jgi:hypothetical protein
MTYDPHDRSADPLADTSTDEIPPPEARDDAVAPAAPAEPPAGPHVAKAGSYFRNVRYVIFVAILAMGAWFLYDGFVTYPEENAQYERLSQEAETARIESRTADMVEIQEEMKDLGIDGPEEPHSNLDLLTQRVLGIALPPIGILLLIRWLYISRGEIKLDGNDVLHAPGHPAVPVNRVKDVDSSQWDRKGIAYIHYDVDGKSSTIKLDDFVYDRGPIDAIYERLKFLKSQPTTDVV